MLHMSLNFRRDTLTNVLLITGLGLEQPTDNAYGCYSRTSFRLTSSLSPKQSVRKHRFMQREPESAARCSQQSREVTGILLLETRIGGPEVLLQGCEPGQSATRGG